MKNAAGFLFASIFFLYKNEFCLANVELVPKDFVEVIHEEQLKKDNLIATLTFLQKVYLLSFKIKPTLYSPEYKSIIHLTTGGDTGEFGFRTPSVYFYNNGKLSVWTTINGYNNKEFVIPEALPLNKWSSIRISQVQINSKFFFRIYVDGNLKIDIKNYYPLSFKNVKVYCADPWYEAQPASIKDLKIFSGNVEQIIEDRETPLAQNNLVAVVPILDKTYKVYFDVKPNSYSEGWHNVIRFNINSDLNAYDDRVPGVWFHNSGDGSLLITVLRKENLDSSFKTAPIPPNTWSHIEISQQLENITYVYTIKLNEEIVFSLENIYPESYENVHVYASDQSHQAQDGFIKDFAIINGKADNEVIPNTLLLPKDSVTVVNEVILKTYNLIATLPFLEKAYLVSFKIKPTSYSLEYKNIIHLTTGGDYEENGYRTPSLYFYNNGKLSVWTTINGYIYKEFIIPEALSLNEWSSIRVSQVRINSIYFFRVYVDGKLKIDIKNSYPYSFTNVKVYCADPWYETQPGSIKDLRIFSGNVEQLIEDRETRLVQNKLVAVIPILDKTYKIYFDVKPNSYSEGWHNVISFNISSDANAYDDRVPGVWFHNSGDGSLSITIPRNGNLNSSFKTAPIPPNNWSHIEISQQLEYIAYVYTIKLNGEKVFSVENIHPESYENVYVYASDQSHEAQDGFIKDFAILNGKADDEIMPNVLLLPKDYVTVVNEEFLKSDNLIATLPFLAKAFLVSFKIKPTFYSVEYKSIIHLTTGGDYEEYGYRIPSLYFYNNGKLSVWTMINGYVKESIIPEALSLNEWSSIRVSQVRVNSIYFLRVFIDGMLKIDLKNSYPYSFTNVKVYCADPWGETQPGSIKDLRIFSGNVEQLIEDRETRLVQNKLVAVVPIWDKTYKIYFDVKPNSYSEGWHNVISFNISSDANAYDDRVPGVWFHNSGDGSLSITIPRNGNLNSSFKTAPIPPNNWSHIEISQQLDYIAYVYTIKLNGEKVFSVENIHPESYENVYVYASDQSHEAQDGFIKDFAILNGKADNEIMPNILLLPKDYVTVVNEELLKSDNLIATLPFLAKAFLVSFKIKPTFYSVEYKSIIHLTTGGDYEEYGYRIPSLYFYNNGKLSVWTMINGYVKESIIPEALPSNKWSSIRVSQVRVNSIYFLRVFIDGMLKIDIKNSYPYSFTNVKVYCADPWSKTQPGSIKDLRIFSGNVEQLIEDRETRLVQNKLVAVVPIWDKTYKIYFDVKPNSYSEGWHNVIRFNIGSDANAYDDRVPGVWFHNSGDGSLSITVPQNGNLNSSFKTAPIPPNNWSHIEISQQLDYIAYVYTIKLNGEKVFSVENIHPESYENVYVYASDQSHEAQDGFIKDFAILNGKADNEIMPNTLLFPKDYVTLVNEESLKNDNLIATLPFLAKSYLVSFKIKPTFYSLEYKSIIHLTTGGDYDGYGYRIPSLYFYNNGQLSVWTTINGYINKEFVIPEALSLNKWSSIRVSQVQINSIYFLRVFVDGMLQINIKNSYPYSFTNVKVYCADPWYGTQPGSIKDLRIFSGNVEQLIEDNETPLVQNKLVAIVPILDKTYKFFFDVKPNSYSEGWHNVVRFIINSDANAYDGRVPGVWFHNSGDGSLSITVPQNGNLNNSFKTAPIPPNNWSHVEISQQLEYGAYVYTIKLNGEKVFSVENIHPESYANVHVYASDQSHEAQDGFIKDFAILNGKADNEIIPNILLLPKDSVTVINEEILKTYNLIATLPFLEKAYLVSFKIKPTSYSLEYKSIIHLTTGGDYEENGYRTPSLYFYNNGKLSVWTTINGYINQEFIIPEVLPLNEWSSIRLSQVQVNSIYFFRVYVDGKLKIDIENRYPYSFKNVRVYCADPWYATQPASIKDLKIFSGNIEQLIEDRETPLVQNKLVAVVPILEKTYKIYFDVKPNSYSQGWHNVIFFNISSDAKAYDDRVPGVWFHNSGNGSLSITVPGIRNLSSLFKTAPIPPNTWSHIEISQQLEYSVYMYTIKLNGEKVFSTENIHPESYESVNVYASDQLHYAQDGFIKDFAVINKKADNEILPNTQLFLKDSVVVLDEDILKKDNLIATLPSLEKAYLVSFKIKPTLFSPGYKNIIHLTTAGDAGDYRFRIPSVYLYDTGKLSIWYSFTWFSTKEYIVPQSLSLNEWTSIRISQDRINSIYFFRIYINGTLMIDIKNTYPLSFDNVKVYCTDPWYETQPASIKDLKIYSGNVEQLIEDRETPLAQNKLVAIVPILDKTYKIYFDVKPNLYSKGWHNVIRFKINSDAKPYNDKVPGVWLHKSGDGSLSITVPRNGNINNSFKTAPIPINMWSHIEISQQLVYSAFVYTIELNGKKVFTEENIYPESYENVHVYASDQFYPAQNGFIKDFAIINGKADNDNLPNTLLFPKDSVVVLDEYILKKDNLVATLPSLEKTYLVSFKIKPNLFSPGYKNIIHLTTGGDASDYGFRIPSVYLYDTGKLSIWYASNWYSTSEYIVPQSLSLNEWTSIRISQDRYNSIYFFRIYINGTLMIDIKNSFPYSFKNVKVYCADPWYETQPASIKDLRIYSGNVEQLIEDKETLLFQNKLVAIVPILDKTYKIFFDVKPNLYSEGWHNVILFNINSDANVFDDRVPGVWFHNSGDGSLSITVPRNGNINNSFKTAPIPFNMWSHIEISQQLEYSAYVYTIKLNGEKVFSIENILPESYANVRVYAADQSYQAQDGFIKDFAIINGKADNDYLQNTLLFPKDSVVVLDEYILKKDNLIATLPSLEKTYLVSFKIKPNLFSPGYKNIIHLTTGGDASDYGFRIPSVYLYDTGKLSIWYATNWYSTSEYIVPQSLSLNEWTSIRISQDRYNSIYFFRIYINGTLMIDIKNSFPYSFKNVKVYCADPWYETQPASIKDLRIYSGNVEQLIEDKETLLFQNKLVAIVPILDKTYKIFLM
ncbi:uncharacterized protein LOC136094806 isoform X3 [Hydra vulgaris]|uniref:uncharacterized protein LOC136094806 isoform X3 n=1 Tax=Hydra vulgaris TaxID=6087 RepID=UPI0032E9F1F4